MENRQALSEQMGYPDPETWLRCEYHDKKKSTAEIAATVNVVRDTILDWLRQYNIKIRSRGGANNPIGKPPVALYKIREMDGLEHMTSDEIAEVVGVSADRVREIARQTGIKYFKRRRYGKQADSKRKSGV